MVQMLLSMLLRDKKPDLPRLVAKPNETCNAVNHVFTRAPMGKARLSHKCECGTFTWQSYLRRWDRR